MSDNATETPDSTGSESLPETSSKAGVKLVILAVVVLGMAGVAYDTLVAKPSVQSAFDAIADESLRLSSSGEDGTIVNTDVHQVIGKTPIETFEDGDRTVEVFGFMGGMLVNKHKLFVSYETVDGKLAYRASKVFNYEEKALSVVDMDPEGEGQYEESADPSQMSSEAVAAESEEEPAEGDSVEETTPAEATAE